VAATTVSRWGDSADGADVWVRVALERSMRYPTVARCLGHGRRWRLVNLRDYSRGRLCGAMLAARAALEVRRGASSATAPGARSGAAHIAEGGDGFACGQGSRGW
jgi:hypothetical protein